MPPEQTGTEGTEAPETGATTEEPTPDPTNAGEQDPGDGDEWKSEESKAAVLEDLAGERAKRKAERERREAAEAELERIRRESMSEQERAVAEARDAALRTANTRLRRAEVLLVASERRFHDPEDAAALIDLDSIDVDEDGNVDRQAVRDAIDELLERKPHLIASDESSSNGSPRGGADVTGGSEQPVDETPEDWNRGLRQAAGFGSGG